MSGAAAADLAKEWGWVRHWTDLLGQSEVWRDAAGTVLRLDDMEPGYCGRVHAFIMRQSEEVYDLIGLQYAAAPDDMSETATVAFDQEFDSFLYDAGADTQAWLRQHPLLVALKHRSEGLSARPCVTAATRSTTTRSRGTTAPATPASSSTDRLRSDGSCGRRAGGYRSSEPARSVVRCP